MKVSMQMQIHRQIPFRELIEMKYWMKDVTIGNIPFSTWAFQPYLSKKGIVLYHNKTCAPTDQWTKDVLDMLD